MTSLAVANPLVHIAPDRIQAIVHAVMDDKYIIEFENHSHAPEDWLILKDMDDPDMARNNCHAVSWAVLEHVVTSIGVDPDQDTHTVELVYLTGAHWSFMVSQGDEQWVLDFTARQFSKVAPGEDIPFPFVAPLDTWVETVDRWLMQGYGQVRTATMIDGE